jgi:uncharacterized repeat protein (TIGR01451 family)
MYPGRTITARFQAAVAPASFFAPGTSVLTNTGYTRGSNAPEVADMAFATIYSAPQNPTISLSKLGFNSTRGETAEHVPVYAGPNETVIFAIHVRNTSSTPATDVTLRDIIPHGITAIAGSVRINGTVASDALMSSGLPLGTLAPGQEVIVIVSGRIAASAQLPAGVTTLLNTAQAAASGIPTLAAQLPVIITNSALIIPPVSTGPGESTVLALIISAIITLLYVGYTGTDTYRRREAGALAKESKKDTGLFNFRR